MKRDTSESEVKALRNLVEQSNRERAKAIEFLMAEEERRFINGPRVEMETVSPGHRDPHRPERAWAVRQPRDRDMFKVEFPNGTVCELTGMLVAGERKTGEHPADTARRLAKDVWDRFPKDEKPDKTTQAVPPKLPTEKQVALMKRLKIKTEPRDREHARKLIGAALRFHKHKRKSAAASKRERRTDGLIYRTYQWQESEPLTEEDFLDAARKIMEPKPPF